jgi:hypothetical protein
VEDNVNVYHVLGQSPTKGEVKKSGFGVMPQQGGQNDPDRFFAAWNPKFDPAPADGQPKVPEQAPGEAGPEAPAFPPFARDAVFRFVDPDVEPGETYVYKIKIHMASPNFKKENVAFANIARNEELDPSPWVFTPTFTVPMEYHLYAVDQQLIDDWAAGKPNKAPLPKDQTTFQIHQWVKKKEDMVNRMTHVIGDWAVAERVFVRRGDPIGNEAVVVVPVWKELKDAFEVPRLIKPNPKDKNYKEGVNVNLAETVVKSDGSEVDLSPPVLVDFVGGKRMRGSVVDEEAAVDALILMPDGKLKVLNSRAAMEPTQAEAVERQDRVILSRRRAAPYLGRGTDAPKKVPGPGN